MLTLQGFRILGLEPFDLELDRGECAVVTGPSGAGKTLLLRAIADLDPHRGAASLDGESRAAMPAPEWRRRVGYLPAEPGWWADRVEEHFLARPDALIDALELPSDMFEREVARLSTGERQRLALARMLEREPRVLLLDEPTAALDQQSTRCVERVLRARLAEGDPILLVSHDAAQAKRLANRRFHISEGRIAEAGGA